MGGDYERFTFDPFKNYAGVFEQQGRVKLSADWNEQVQLVDRRWRAETLDILGRCIVPDSTPEAFRITPTGSGSFTIGIGRMYVDGLLAECHGLEPLIYDDSLGEQRGTTEIPYTDQPYFPAPVPPQLPSTVGTTDLVYLHVWQREVTAIADPEIQEKALGGPDTATRLQTAWRVGVLSDVGSLSCSDPSAAWDELTAPSAGRLTTSAIAPPTSDDPCIISPSGGYRGLENRFYRVEIHQAGALGTARFKWSRDNGSIAAAVEAISPGQDRLTVTRLGRDQVLRFHIDDWVEVWDDPLEFSRAAGLADTAGHLARITAIDEANRILTIAPAIPASFSFDATDPDRHTRVQRWDQQSDDGLLDVTAGPIDLEDGVRVSFSTDPAGGEFKVGDYWSFAARTIDGSVELLQSAPAHGILHHYCRLALITWGDTPETTTVLDCRVPWPSPCCEGFCTVTVGDGIDSEGDFSDIQAAIDSLDSRGGVVCIGRGVFPVSRSIRLEPSNRHITIRGTGPATRILFIPEENTPASFMLLRSTEHVRIENLFVASLSARDLINAINCHFCTVQDCALVNLNVQTDAGTVSGRGIELLQNCVGWKIERNAILAAKGIVSTAAEETQKVSHLQIWNNQFLGVQGAVLIQNAEQLSIRHNRLEGLEQATLEELQSVESLSRETINGFQLQVSQAFRRTVEFDITRFQAVGILIVSGNRIEISHNLISAQIGILIFLGINAQLVDNQLLALIGFLLVFGILIHIADSLVLALLIGLLQVGIVVNLLCEGNLWFGFFGIVLQSLAEAVESLAPLLGNALVNGGFSNNGSQTFNTTLTQGQAAVGSLNAFGLATTVKIHRNIFFNFFRGIYKSDAVVSADFSFVDNTFMLCSEAAIELGQLSQVIFQEQGQSLIPRHLIQGNGFTVTGIGIVSASVYTFIQDNSITCPQVAIDIDGANSTIRNNLLRGTARETNTDVGLIVVRNSVGGLWIAGNRLQGGPGHGILIDNRVFNLVIEDNVIEFMRQNGISTRNDLFFVDTLRISRNTIQQCLVGAVNAIPWMSGAIAIGGGQNVQITDNTINGNQPNVSAGQRFYAIYGENLNGIQLMHNLVSENVRNPNQAIGEVGGIRLNFVAGDIKIIGNTIRNNGGQALVINAPSNLQQRAIVQGNHFISEANNRFLILVLVEQLGHLQFQDNQSAHFPAQLGQVSLPASVVLVGALLIVHGNTVRSTNNQVGLRIVATAGSNSRGILTSNLTTGPPQALNYPAGTLAQAHNLQLP